MFCWRSHLTGTRQYIVNLSYFFQGRDQRLEKLEVNLHIKQEPNKELQNINSPTPVDRADKQKEQNISRPLACETVPWQHCPCPKHNEAIDSISLESVHSEGNQPSGQEVGIGPVLDQPDPTAWEDTLMYRPFTLGGTCVALCYQPSILTLLITCLLLWAQLNCIVSRFWTFMWRFFNRLKIFSPNNLHVHVLGAIDVLSLINIIMNKVSGWYPLGIGLSFTVVLFKIMRSKDRKLPSLCTICEVLRVFVNFS